MQQVKEYIYRKQNSLPPPPKEQLPENLFAYRCFHFFFLTCLFLTKKKITVR